MNFRDFLKTAPDDVKDSSVADDTNTDDTETDTETDTDTDEDQ